MKGTKIIACLERNSPTILSCLGAIGVIATTVLAVRATPKALQSCYNVGLDRDDEPSKLEYLKVALPHYIPSLMVGSSTIACILGANALNKKQQASLVSAYILADNVHKEYINTTKVLLGSDADTRVRESIVKHSFDNDICEIANDKRLFYEPYLGRCFESTIEEVLTAEHLLNRMLISTGSVTLNDFFDLLDVGAIDGGDTIGWSIEEPIDCYGYSCIDFSHDIVEMDDGLECCIIDTSFSPTLIF